MGSLKMNDEQRIALAVKAFTFYVEIEDELHAREVLEYLEANGDESMACLLYTSELGDALGALRTVDEVHALARIGIQVEVLLHACLGEPCLLYTSFQHARTFLNFVKI